MKQSTKEQIEQAVDFIIKQNQNPEVKKLLASKGYKLIPNSLNYVLTMLNNIGYKIIPPEKSSNIQNNTNNNEIQHLGKTNISTFQLFGERDIKTENKETKEESYPWETDINTNGVINTDKKSNEYISDNIELFNEVQNKWSSILQITKETSILVYSLIVNSQLLCVKENTLILGFNKEHTYQLKQFSLQENQNILISVIKNRFKFDVNIKSIITQDLNN